MSIFSPDDRFYLGEGLFETIRVVNKKPCYPQLHWQRMRASALELNIPFTTSEDQWHGSLDSCIKNAEIEANGIKVILTGGRANRGLTMCGKRSQILFNAFAYKPEVCPISLMSAPWVRDGRNPIYRHKSINYLEAIQGKRLALAQGMDDVLFFNTKDHALETTISNLFVIQENVILTPKVECGILPGIIRSKLLEICKKEKIPCFEQLITSDDIHNSIAAFTTNSLQGIRSVRSFDGTVFNATHPQVAVLSKWLNKDLYDQQY